MAGHTGHGGPARASHARHTVPTGRPPPAAHVHHEISHATIASFNSTAYTASITLAESPAQTIDNVPVSRGLATADLTAGNTIAVVFFDRSNPADAMVVGVVH